MEDIVIPILVCVVLPIAIVWIVNRTRQNETNRKAEIMLKAIENGSQVDPDYFKPTNKAAKKRTQSIKQDLLDKLTGACITSFMGLAFIGMTVVTNYVPAFDRKYWFEDMMPVAGGVLLAVGVALFISYHVGKKMLAGEIEAEERALHAPKEQ